MPNNLAHFAIHADDVERARRFYTAVFGWTFEAWGPPGFYQIRTGTVEAPGLPGALHARSEPGSGRAMIGFECTVSVQEIEPVRDAVIANGGTVLLDGFIIPTVGTLLRFADTEGNIVAAMRYEANHG